MWFATMTLELEQSRDSVGPVLQRGAAADAVVAAIRTLNPSAALLDRGAYVRVLVPHRCVVTRVAIEERLGRPFVLPRDLEAIMSAFKGRFCVDDERAVWEFRMREGGT